MSIAVVMVAASLWTLEAQKQTFALHTRVRDDGVLEYRLSGAFASPLDVVRRIIVDPKANGTVPQLIEERVLGADGAARIFYNRIRVPIVDDRDYCVRVENEDLSGGGFRQTWRLWKDCPAPPEGVVRMVASEGNWELQPGNDPRSTIFVMRQSFDSGGWLPRWLVRSTTIDQLVEFPSLMERAARRILMEESRPASAQEASVGTRPQSARKSSAAP